MFRTSDKQINVLYFSIAQLRLRNLQQNLLQFHVDGGLYSEISPISTIFYRDFIITYPLNIMPHTESFIEALPKILSINFYPRHTFTSILENFHGTAFITDGLLDANL